MKVFWIVCLVLLIMVLFVLGIYLLVGYIGWHISLSRKGKVKKLIEKNYSNHLKNLNIDENYFNQDFETIKIKSQDNLTLTGYYKNICKSDKLAVLVHGYGGNHKEMANYAKIFDKRGYDIFTFDQRCHGVSEGDELTMGQKESEDLLDWINKMIEINPKYKIVLLGISMGASTVCIACGNSLPSNVVLAIEDCGYDNAYNQFAHVYFKRKFSFKFIFKIFYNFTKKTKNFDLKKASPEESLKKSKIPIMFIHGGLDNFVPAEMVNSLASQLPEQRKTVYIVEGAGHVASLATNPRKYENEINKFMSKFYM